MIGKEPLITHVDSKKIDPKILKRASSLIYEHNGDYLRYPVQLDDVSHKLVKQIKNDYDIYYYDAIKESLLLMYTLLKKGSN